MNKTRDIINFKIYFLRRQIELLEKSNDNPLKLVYLNYQLKKLYFELEKVNNNEVYKGNGR